MEVIVSYERRYQVEYQDCFSYSNSVVDFVGGGGGHVNRNIIISEGVKSDVKTHSFLKYILTV